MYPALEPYTNAPVGVDDPKYEDTIERLKKPFNCSEYKELGLSGVAFEIQEAVSPDKRELCFLAGVADVKSDDACSFNEAVAFLKNSNDSKHPAYRMALGFLGFLLFTPERVDEGVSSESVYEDTIVGSM